MNGVEHKVRPRQGLSNPARASCEATFSQTTANDGTATFFPDRLKTAERDFRNIRRFYLDFYCGFLLTGLRCTFIYPNHQISVRRHYQIPISSTVQKGDSPSKSPHLYNYFAFSVAVLLLALAGCGGNREPASELISVVGQITLDGQPPRSATVSFIPENEKLETVKAPVSPRGMYSLSSKDRAGVLAGRYKVVVETLDGSKYTTAVEVVKDANAKRYDLQLTKK